MRNGPVLVTLTAACLAGLLGGPAAAVQGPVSINGQGPDASSFFLVLNDTGACGLFVSGEVVTDAGGGTDTFSIAITDEGAVIESLDFALPADGASHPLEFQYDFEHLFVNDDYGVTIDDPGGIGLLELPDLFTIDSCSIQTIPTLSSAGAAGLGLLLAAAAAVVLARRRRA